MKEVIATIVVPVYNTKDTLNRTVESIINQTYDNLDILLIDDGSEIDTKKICDEWVEKDNRIRCVHKDNEGLGFTRNRGLDEALGKYIFFVDSDDYIESNMVSKMVDKAERYNADIVCSNFFFDEKKELCLLSEGIYSENIKSYLLPRILGRLKYGEDDFFNVSTCTKLYSVEFLRKNKLLCKSEREYIWEDMVFNFDCLLYAEKIYVLQDWFYHYCYNSNSVTHLYDSLKIDKISKMYSYFKHRVKGFKNEKEYIERLSFSVMGNIRMCIKQVVKYCSLMDAKNEIERICNKKEVIEVAKTLKKENLSASQNIYNYAVKHRMVCLVYLLTYIQNIVSAV